MAHGHMIPLVDMARQFARHGSEATIILTPGNATLFSRTIERDREHGLQINIRLIVFPSSEVGLPEGCENLSSTTSQEMSLKIHKANELLQQPFEQLLEEDHPDCLVADVFIPWATDVATKVGIPRLAFHRTNAFSLCVHHVLHNQEPHKNIESNMESFIVPDLPDTIK